MDVPTLCTVEVPMTSRDRSARGFHVFTGPAAGPRQALAAAHAAWRSAREHLAAGREVPRAGGREWCARAVRPDWCLEWDRAGARIRDPFFPLRPDSVAVSAPASAASR
ncbi:hypothetical protein AB0O18_07160 [Streptomyces sp. NPDC093224]|uniref:hypothetical protein n=1 Tax=Streptomyces sp. NPDC093224 TaxID=3155198 RepID=UPI0034450B40